MKDPTAGPAGCGAAPFETPLRVHSTRIEPSLCPSLSTKYDTAVPPYWRGADSGSQRRESRSVAISVWVSSRESAELKRTSTPVDPETGCEPELPSWFMGGLASGGGD